MKRTWIWTLTLAAALVGCGQGEQGGKGKTAGGSGTIQLASLPKAEVLIDGKLVGETPLTHSVSAGSHEIVLRSEAFVDHKETGSVDADKTWSVDCVLKASDPNDPVAIAKLAKAFEIGEWTEFEPQVRHRGGRESSFVVALYPRGKVRLEDLSEYRIDVGDEFEAAGTLRFKRGSKVLFEAAFDPEELSTQVPVPEKVLKTLKSGAQVTWGFYPAKGKATTAKFKVVKDDPRLTKRLAKMEKRMADADEVTLCQMRAQLYLNKKLYVAAYLEARRALALAKDAETPPSQALAIMQGAAQRMNLKKTPLWDEIQGEIGRVPSRVKERRAKVRR